MEVGKTFNRALWRRVLMTAQEMERTAPKPGKTTN
jgi:hypothetical protein